MLSAFQTKLNLTTLTQKVSLGARNRQTSLRLCDTSQRLLCNTGLQQGEKLHLKILVTNVPLGARNSQASLRDSSTSQD